MSKAPDFRIYVPVVGLVVVLLVVGGWVLRGIASPEPWLGVATVKTVQREGVVYREAQGIYLVSRGGSVIALSEISPWYPEKERVSYCPTSGMFETSLSGSKFDRFGRYYGGPAPRGLDRIAVKIEDFPPVVYVNPRKVTSGPERDEVRPLEPVGPFCSY